MSLDLNKTIISGFGGLFVAICLVSVVQAANSYDRIKVIKKQILEQNDFEHFSGQRFPPRIKKVILSDLCNSDHQQAIVLLNPYFRQSPFILIYHLSNEDRAVRIAEGLAPGKLVPVSGKYLDSHTLEVFSSDLQATDLHLGDKQHDLQARTAFRDEALKKKINIVEYPSFFHIDGRKGNGIYIDMTHIEEMVYESCANFEFSTIVDISAGHIASDKNRNYLVAIVKTKIYIYRIDEITEQGLLKKKIWVIPKPKDFRKLLLNENGNIIYQNVKGNHVKFDFVTMGK